MPKNPETDSFIRALRGDVVIPDLAPSGALTLGSAIALRAWFTERLSEITSSGGRPTNPEWTIKRQIPFDERTWECLKAIASDMSSRGRTVSPAQIAATVLKELVHSKTGIAPRYASVSQSDGMEDLPERDRAWKLPSLYAA
jgi:hypothetical protein